MANEELGRRAFLASAMGGTLALSGTATSEAVAAPSPAPVPVGAKLALTDLETNVRSVISSKRIGTPVFARLMLTSVTKEQTVPMLTRAVGLIERWFSQKRSRMHSVGTGDNVTLSLGFPSGASAIITIASSVSTGSPFDLLLLGHHGSVLHDFGNGLLGPTSLVWDTLEADPAIEQAVREVLK